MARDKDKQAAYNKRYRAANKEELAAKAKRKRAENPEKYKASDKKSRARNKEKRRADNKQYHAKNKDRIAKRHKQWQDDNPEKTAAQSKKWYAKNPAYYKQRTRAGNADKFGISLEDALARQDGRCLICLKSEPTSKTGNLLAWAMDHDHQCCPSGKGCPSCFRGVICSSCNRVLGYAYDDPGILRRGADYLEAWDIRKEGPAEGPSNLE
jgi:hypothetical protein